jgi:hypothetical protein
MNYDSFYQCLDISVLNCDDVLRKLMCYNWGGGGGYFVSGSSILASTEP